jgi:hypothetical protein
MTGRFREDSWIDVFTDRPRVGLGGSAVVVGRGELNV